jgi:hypothetical protein
VASEPEQRCSPADLRSERVAGRRTLLGPEYEQILTMLAGPAWECSSVKVQDLNALAPPVGIHVADAADGEELVECLWRHGFAASLVESDAGWRVEVRSPREDTSRLVADLHEAIARWRPDASVEPRPLS